MSDDQPLIVIVDDDEGICRALSRLLRSQGFRSRSYSTAQAYFDESDALNPSCALVDIRMPELDGLALVRQIRAGGNDVPIVFMTAAGDIPTIVGAMREGAVDVLAKPFTLEQLGAAITRAVHRSVIVDRSRRGLDDIWRSAANLTPREAEVCGLVACGLPNKRVAALIGTKEKTVKVHRGRVMQKLGVASLAELVLLVDRLLAERRRDALRLDGLVIARPRAASIIVDVMTHECPAEVTEQAVDQRTMPPPARADLE
jgi:FixJ family two-component response regulator